MRALACSVLLGSAALVAGALMSTPAASGEAAGHGTVASPERFGMYDPHSKPARPGGGGGTSKKTLSYHGGIDGIGVTSGGQPQVYLVFWGTQWGSAGTSNGYTTFSADSASAAPRVQALFKGLGSNGEHWSSVMTQYCDGPNVAKGATSCPSNAAHVLYPVGGVLAGVWYDNASAAPSAASQSQLASEAVRAASHFGNTTQALNRDAQYVVLSAPGTNPDNYKTSGFCAWHTYTTSAVGDVAFTNMPYVMDVGASCGANFVNSGSAGATDGYTIVEGHEYSETITDQNPNGGWLARSGQENADECAWLSPGTQGGAGNVSFSTGTFPLQGTWSNNSSKCQLQENI